MKLVPREEQAGGHSTGKGRPVGAGRAGGGDRPAGGGDRPAGGGDRPAGGDPVRGLGRTAVWGSRWRRRAGLQDVIPCKV